MVRRVLEELCVERGATGNNLKDRIIDLSKKIVLPQDLLQAADHLRLLGNDAAHIDHRNSVPSTQMRCMITANRRASATIAFFIPRCLAIFMAQALSQDHFAVRTSMI